MKLLWKNFTGCKQREIWSGVFRTSLHMALAEPQRSEDPTPEKYIRILTVSTRLSGTAGVYSSEKSTFNNSTCIRNSTKTPITVKHQIKLILLNN